ncbi:hypothetical protein JCM10207_008500 [Rhodosporidiobolus poonsookiae]
MATLKVNTHSLPHQRSPWSPLASPVGKGESVDLSARCRLLARSFGHDAVQDDPVFVHADEPRTPESRQSPSASPGRSPHTASSAFSPLSPRSGHTALHPPPTPEGSFILSEILEEGEGESTPKVEKSEPGTSSLGVSIPAQEGQYGTSATADDELSLNSNSHGFGAQRRKSSFTGGVRDVLAEQLQADEMAEAIVEEEETAFKQALKEGQTWQAVDLWLVNGELLVGADQRTLDPTRTFSSCIVEPLLRVFQTSIVPVGTAHRRRSSVFAHINVHHPFQLVIRLHTPASLTFPFVVDALQPLNDASLLTTYCPNGCVTTPALITVVSSDANGAEKVSVEDLTAVAGPRFVYRDAEIAAFENDVQAKQANHEITPVAAGNLEQATGWNGQTPLADEQRARIVKQVEGAHRVGIKVRYEGLPNFPVHVRESVRSTLVGLSVDYL